MVLPVIQGALKVVPRAIRPGINLLKRLANRPRGGVFAKGPKPVKPPKKPAGAVKSAVLAGAGVAGGTALVDAVLDDGSPAQVVGPSGARRPRVSRRKSDLIQMSQLEVVKDILSDPLYSFLLGYLAIEFAQKNGLAGETSGSIAQIAMGGIAYAKAISPLVAQIGPAATEVSGPGVLGIPGIPFI